MSDKSKSTQDWAAAKVALATTPLSPEEQEIQALLDEAVGMLRISFSGVDVTRHLGPVLPPELRDRKREP